MGVLVSLLTIWTAMKALESNGCGRAKIICLKFPNSKMVLFANWEKIAQDVGRVRLLGSANVLEESALILIWIFNLISLKLGKVIK